MPAKPDLTQTSQQIAISFESVATAGNYTEKRIDLQLNPLDEEVFVVTAVKMDLDLTGNLPVNLFGGGNTNKIYGGQVALTKNSRPSALSNLGENTCFATAREFLGTAEDSQAGGDYAVAYSIQEDNSDTPSQLGYIDIIATNDFFVGLEAAADATNLKVYGKVYGYRARAKSSIYAALVQSEVLSS